jgi:hypothetical protein
MTDLDQLTPENALAAQKLLPKQLVSVGGPTVRADPPTNGFGASETLPETGNGFCAPETFCFWNSFRGTYSVPDTLGFGNVIRAPESSDFPE